MSYNEIRITIHEGVKERGFIRGWSSGPAKLTASQPFRLNSARSISDALRTIIKYLNYKDEPVFISIDNPDE